ncbi:MAG TPA: threonine aldolase, partial [Chitinophagaceae bacterium]|jgi:threonine aldolase|nr:threonine aldolase [Chitinophagaceae bacterium]
LQNNIQRLADDHRHAKQIADVIAQKDFVKMVLPVETNIIIFELADATAPALVKKLSDEGILSYAIAPNRVRLVVHLDISEAMVTKTCEIFETRVNANIF